jgi:hypothetical protein
MDGVRELQLATGGAVADDFPLGFIRLFQFFDF